MGEFTNVVTYDCRAYENVLSIIMPVSVADTYYNMKLSSDAEETDITKIITSENIGTNLMEGKYIFDQIGTYFCQFNFSFSGSASANYKIRAVLNEEEIKQSVCQFTTRGSNVMWEVGMTFIIDIEYKITSTNTGLYSSKNELILEYKNVLGTGNLNFVNGIFSVIKID